MARMRTTTVLILAVSAGAAHPVVAQELRPSVFAGVGVANLFRAEDRSFGTEMNLGGGAGIEWKRLGLDVEVNRTTGLTPRVLSCGVTNVPCTGSAREGFLQGTMLATNVSYFFGRSRVRPYVTGSVGLLWTESVNSVTVVSQTMATLSEFEERDTGLALGVGAGVDVPLTSGLSLRPEFRTYSSVLMSRTNLGVHRGTIGVRYRW